MSQCCGIEGSRLPPNRRSTIPLMNNKLHSVYEVDWGLAITRIFRVQLCRRYFKKISSPNIFSDMKNAQLASWMTVYRLTHSV
jgi:hypothetical protein